MKVYYYSCSFGLFKNERLRKILNIKYYHRFVKKYDIADAKGFVVWKKHLKKTKQLTSKYKQDILYLEDSPIATMHDKNGKKLQIGYYYSKMGWYYQSNNNIIESIIKNSNQITDSDIEYVQRCIEKIKNNKITKYNTFHTEKPFSRQENVAPIVVIDQNIDDFAITRNNNCAADFILMYKEALKKGNGRKIYLKSSKNGYLKQFAHSSEVALIDFNVNIHDVLENVEDVYVVCSHVGFEALMHKKNVHCFGYSYYSGFGLTINYKTQNIYPLSLEKIFYALYIQLSTYIINDIVKLDIVLEIIAINKKLFYEERDKRFFIVSTHFWHRLKFYRFLYSRKLIYISNIKALQTHNLNSNDVVLTWSIGKKQYTNFCQEQNIPLFRMEDGFIRSVGLGSHFVQGHSFCIDKTNIYFNARRSNDLENELNNTEVLPTEIEQACNLIKIINKNQITKYNLPFDQKMPKEEIFMMQQIQKSTKRKILIIGQVANDKSVLHGCLIHSNIYDLLKQTRIKNPDKIIIFKNHPDCVLSFRAGKIQHKNLANYTDYVLEQITIDQVIDIVDEIHTFTSLSGMEGLIRGKEVYCYGSPFYSNWGLTHDVTEISRRLRKRTLEELVYLSYIKYPRYYDHQLNIFVTVFDVIKTILLEQNTYKKRPALFMKISNIIKIIVVRFYYWIQNTHTL